MWGPPPAKITIFSPSSHSHPGFFEPQVLGSLEPVPGFLQEPSCWVLQGTQARVQGNPTPGALGSLETAPRFLRRTQVWVLRTPGTGFPRTRAWVPRRTQQLGSSNPRRGFPSNSRLGSLKNPAAGFLKEPRRGFEGTQCLGFKEPRGVNGKKERRW
ncbi:hypothetical protein SLEP1_g26083 [Rubroshorea leprosula]|uniref:Uncharacterized protein n=1 Tax=Rubroshorea leprosula TaxID=152421 RepID=A0AAV5JX60_9ROSI|nr:hypothetical protein SLEP1_g26083 [Rubroshorea leprosula]